MCCFTPAGAGIGAQSGISGIIPASPPRWRLTASGKKGVGLDTISLDPIADTDLTLHKRLFREHDIVIIENLDNLDRIGPGLFTLCALPMRHADADGSPIRAVAMVD